MAITALSMVLVVPLVLAGFRESDRQRVDVETIGPRSVRASVLASGSFVFREQALLSAETMGRVREILVREGDPVRSGQVVMRLEREAHRAEVDQQQSVVRQQRIDIERQALNVREQAGRWKRSRELHAMKLLDDASHDQARHAYDGALLQLRSARESLRQAEAMLAQAHERLARTEVRAPIDGTVTSIDIKVGETAVPSSVGIAGSNLLTIADLGTISTEVNVDEADIARIKVGQQAEINAAAFPDVALKGTVASIPLSPSKAAAGAAGASQARSYLVRIRLADPSSVVLRPGMSCRAEILTHTPGRALAVPVQALFTNDQAHASNGKRPAQEHHVFVDVEGRVERRAVIPGVSDDSHVEIRKGVKAGERVIVGPYKVLRHLRPGDEVDASGTSGARS